MSKRNQSVATSRHTAIIGRVITLSALTTVIYLLADTPVTLSALTLTGLLAWAGFATLLAVGYARRARVLTRTQQAASSPARKPAPFAPRMDVQL
ncbi:hypothetical protein [Actinomadura rudentiformis]|uniref:Uncharacterized protein n=1 Tax=Actinomadura rudentiformis TaxID=359158 RepID=A0A6H9Z0J0_9ACTN|nr:hypothetical protein [Actinomadura rudentiformis]KAB2347381.1 hypothetical protein F8566_20425 [Actinomadura rudentiformis]